MSRDTHAPDLFRKTRVPHGALDFLHQIPPAIIFRTNPVQVHHGKGTPGTRENNGPVFQPPVPPLIFLKLTRCHAAQERPPRVPREQGVHHFPKYPLPSKFFPEKCFFRKRKMIFRTSMNYLKKNEAHLSPLSPLSPGEHVFPAGVERKVPGDRGDLGCNPLVK